MPGPPCRCPADVHARIFQMVGAPVRTVNAAILNTHNEHFGDCIISGHSPDILALGCLDRHIFPVSTSALTFTWMSQKQYSS